ncbi:MAG: helix-turn-helix domain-containing protein [Sandaracinus sp.]|nr:helix-turn-helix domain-containing protein [Myxococcales bacterium]MCB9618499.1 helix-turn-helix domain-containing protein [Sandaracinus sp.]MCB9630649.1 helix-turn-helix domain-containing protein [Sandaracinus sp.]
MPRRESGNHWRESDASEPEAVCEAPSSDAPSVAIRERTGALERFFVAPSERVLVRSTFVLTCTHGGVWALRAWGRVERESIDELVEVLSRLAERPERRQLFDLRGIETYSADAMAAVVDFYASHPRYASTIAREAVVRPDGLVGVFAEGFFRAVDVPFPTTVVTAEADALAFLGEPAGALAFEGWEIERASDVVWRVREAVVALGASARLDDVARALGTSGRSLQRGLAVEGTSFRSVRRDALADEIDRLRASQRWTLKEIAARLGFRSLGRLSELYREARGRAPSRG